MAIDVNILGKDVQLSGNPVEIKCSGGAVPADSSEYKIMLRVISEDGKLFGSPFTPDAIAPDNNGEALFDISLLVDQPVKATFQFPAVGVYAEYPTQAFNVQVQAGERYIDVDGDLQEIWGAVSDVIQMLKGGLNPRQIAIMNTTNTSFFDMYVEGGRFLTARPNGDQVHPVQNVKLCYMVGADKAAVILNIKTVFDDGSENNFASNSFSLSKDSLYEFNVNPALHGVAIETPTKKAVYFIASLSGGETSVEKPFYYDWRYCERPIFLFFKNSLGGIDDVFFSGYIKDQFATSGTTYYTPFQNDFTVFDPTIVVSDKQGQNKWQFNTGFKSLTVLQYYRDLFLARQAWYLYSNNSQSTFSIIPLIIDNMDKTLVDRKLKIFDMDISVTEAHQSPFVFDNRSF